MVCTARLRTESLHLYAPPYCVYMYDNPVNNGKNRRKCFSTFQPFWFVRCLCTSRAENMVLFNPQIGNKTLARERLKVMKMCHEFTRIFASFK